MDEQFDLAINGVTKREYVQAGSEILRRMVVPLIALVALFTMVIALAVQNFSLRSLLLPFAVAFLFLLILYIAVVMSWKKFPHEISFSYLIDCDGWEITVGESRANIDWKQTPLMKVRRDVVLLYSESGRSNLLPRRCLTDEQLAQIKAWYRDSRAAYRAWQKEDDERFRKEQRLKHLEQRSRRKQRW